MGIRLLNYNDCKKGILLTLLSGKYEGEYRVPMIMGERGTGKTSMAWELAEELDANMITIDANVLKEGEITGIPCIKKYKQTDGKIRQVVDYATYCKLQDTQDLYDENPKKMTILFIDELNRCDSIVKRELMNLILNREINGFYLPDNVSVITACNPSSDFSVYQDTDYQVEDMDEAQKDRFRWFALQSDINSWIKWALSTKEDSDDTYIDKEIVEFLSERETFLNNIQTSKEDIKTSPRSWEAASNTYRTWLKSKKKYNLTTEDLLNSIAGDVGSVVATDFIVFLEDNKNPLIKPKEIFEGDSFSKKELTKDVVDTIKKESILRKNILCHNCLNYIKKEFVDCKGKLNSTFKVEEMLFIDILTKTLNNNDLMYSLLLDMRLSKKEDDIKYLKHLLSLKNVDIINAFTKLNQSF